MGGDQLFNPSQSASERNGTQQDGTGDERCWYFLMLKLIFIWLLTIITDTIMNEKGLETERKRLVLIFFWILLWVIFQL